MSDLRAGVVGAGVFGGHHARKYAADKRTRLVGLYDPDAPRARALANDLGVEAFARLGDMLSVVDVITVASPATHHASAARAALDAGKDVLIEKPIATDPRDARELVRIAEANRATLACGHQERAVFEAMGLFAALEKPTRIESVREGNWTGRNADVSATLDLMVHDLDLALRLMGAAPNQVRAEGRALHGAPADEIIATLNFTNGEARFTSSRIAETRRRVMRIVYPSGAVVVDFLARTFENGTPFSLNANFAETPLGADPLGANVSRFIDAATGAAKRPLVTGAEAADVLDLALAIDRAAKLPSLAG